MGTRCFIGLKTHNGLEGVYCHNGGNVRSVGIKLNQFYNTRTIIKDLINRGSIISLGSKVECPKLPYNNISDANMCWLANSYFKTSFTLAYSDLYQNKDIDIIHAKDVNQLAQDNSFEYLYIFDGLKWFVYVVNGVFSKSEGYNNAYHKLSHLCCELNYDMERFRKDISEKFILDENKRRECELRQLVVIEEKNLALSDVETCNKWLYMLLPSDKEHSKLFMSQVPVMGIEFGYSETKMDGKNYAIYQTLQQGQTKRKVLLRSKNLNDLTLAVCEKYGINPFVRPIFSSDSILN